MCGPKNHVSGSDDYLIGAQGDFVNHYIMLTKPVLTTCDIVEEYNFYPCNFKGSPSKIRKIAYARLP